MPYSDYPTEESKPIPYKLIGIVSSGVILAVLIIGGVIRYVNTSNKVDLSVQDTEVVQKRVETCDQDANPELCRKLVIEQVIKQFGAAEACASLPSGESDGCFWKFAREHQDPEVCSAVVDESMKSKCRDTAYYELGVMKMDTVECGKIESILLKKACLQKIEPPLTAANCLERGNPQSECEILAVLEQAIAKQDPLICNQLQDADQISVCSERADINDPDFDGLLTADESSYGSDPRNPDTDGDGYNDGDEVLAGYDPNGPGMLDIPDTSIPFELPF